jgi:hypothetical protein
VPTHDIAARIEEDFMKGKLTLAAVAVAFAMLSVPGTASAGHYRYDWSKRDHWGWMHRGWDCERKVVKHKKKHYYVARKAKKAKKPAK